MTTWTVHYRGMRFTTRAASAARAISNVRWREGLRYAPMCEFSAEEAS